MDDQQGSMYCLNERPHSLNITQSLNAAGVEITSRSCLIMDEVDGMSAGDRGGVGALAALIKKTHVCPHWLNSAESRANISL